MSIITSEFAKTDPEFERPTAPPPRQVVRRSFARRVVRALSIGTASLVGLVALALIGLQTPWGKELVRSRVEAKLGAAVNGTVTVGSVDYGWLFRDIEIGGVEIRDAHGGRAIGLDALRVTLDRGSLLRGAPVLDALEIGGLDVAIVKHADGSSNLTTLFKKRSGGKPMASIGIAHLAVDGMARITKPDGTTIAVRDLRLSGSVTARPIASEVELALRDLGAHVLIDAPGKAPRHLAVGIASVDVERRGGQIEVDVANVILGAVGIDRISGRLAVDAQQLVGEQTIEVAGLRVDADRLAMLLGRELLSDDLRADLKIHGPANALVADGGVRSGEARMALVGRVDASDVVHPSYDLSLIGTGLGSAVLASHDPERPRIETSLHASLIGSGITRDDADAKFELAVGATRIGALAVDGLHVRASAHRGVLALDHLLATAPGLELAAAGAIDADRAVSGTLELHGIPATIRRSLKAAGLVVPARLKLPPRVDLAVTASGHLDGTVTVSLPATRLAIAGGTVSLGGSARLEQRALHTATGRVRLDRLDLAGLAGLAGKPARVAGAISGSLELSKTPTSKTVDYDLALALSKLGLDVAIEGRAQPSSVTSRIEAVRARDRAVLATVEAAIPLTRRGGKPALDVKRDLALDIDVAKRSFAELAELVPSHLRAKLPAGAFELHVDLGGTVARPTGTIELAATATAVRGQEQRAELLASLAPTDRGVGVTTRGAVWIRDEHSPIASLDATISTVAPSSRGRIDVAAMKAAAVVDAVITLPERELASLSFLRQGLAKIGGRFDGRIAVAGPLAEPKLDASIRMRDFPTAAGGKGYTTVIAHGTPRALTARLQHGTGVAIEAEIDRTVADRIGVDITARAKDAPLLQALPALLAPKLGKHEPGRLSWDMTAKLALVRSAGGLAVERADVLGTLDIVGGVLAVPGTGRRWHDIDLSIASEPTGLRLRRVALHESDRQVSDRRLEASGFVAWDRFHPQHVDVSLSARDWLLSGSPLLGAHDAPRATADFDLAVGVDLRKPVIAVDATVESFELDNPDRLDRGHHPEQASVSGDIIYLDGTTRAGALPVAPRPIVTTSPAPPREKRPVDVRVRIAKPIRLRNGALDVVATGDLTVAIRTDATTTRGGLVFHRGTLNAFGRDYALVDGRLEFSDEHPKGWLEATFDHALPPAVMRDLSLTSAGGGARMRLAGPLSAPKPGLGGASNAGLADAMAIHTTGHPVHVSAPDLPASATVVAPRGDQLQVLTFMAGNLPHLLFLDRITAYADPYASRSAYGRIENVEAERYAKDQRSRVKTIVRPPTPGRSRTEVHYDRLLINDKRRAIGVGVRAGDRAGGGVGAFIEWSSDE